MIDTQLRNGFAYMNKLHNNRPALTHGGTDRSWEVCQCRKCKTISQCTPMNDFYTKPGDPNGPLYCETCIMYD